LRENDRDEDEENTDMEGPDLADAQRRGAQVGREMNRQAGGEAEDGQEEQYDHAPPPTVKSCPVRNPLAQPLLGQARRGLARAQSNGLL
jgi:hypothetical protein